MSVNQSLSMIRGDTLSFDVVLSDIDVSSVVSMYFTVKKKATDQNFVIQKSLANGIEHIGENTYRVRIAPEDTDDVAAGGYVYDLQVGIQNDIYTLLMGSFRITQDVTFER